MDVLSILAQVTVFSVVLYLAILLFRKLFAGRISAALQYGVWFVLVIRLMLPFTFDGGIHFFTLPQEPVVAMEETLASAEQGEGLLPAQEGDEEPFLPAAGTAHAVADNPDLSGVSNVQPARGGHAQPWSAAQFVAAVWGAGMALTFAWFLSAFVRLSRRITRSGKPLTDAERRVFNEVAREMGVKDRIEPLRTGGVTAPALTVNLFPKLLLPGGNPDGTDRSGEDLENIFRHELTHYRRGDHLVCLLLVVLRCVHWFNPVVWLAPRQMELDMEISCDSIAARRMNIDRKRRYASTILALLGRDGKERFVMGMGMETVRRNAEKRLRGIFMVTKSARFTRFSALLSAVVLFAACFTTACVPTTEAAAPTTMPTTAAPAVAPTPTVADANTPTTAATNSPAVTADAGATLEPTPTPTIQPAAPSPAAFPDLRKIQAKRARIASNIAAGSLTFAIRMDLTVAQAGQDEGLGEFDTSKWSKIVAISTGFVHVVGLRSNGTVVVAGSQRAYLSRELKDWKNIVAISAGGNDVVMGLRSDGTVLSTGIAYDSADPDKVKNWKGIIAIAAGERFGVGLKADRTVVATGNNEYGQCDVDGWTDIVAIAAGERNVVGLKADGTVVAAGFNNDGRCNVQSWRDIVSVAVGGYCIIGLKADGTVVTAGDNYLGQCNTQGWKDIIAVAGGSGHTIGLRKDGTVMAVGLNEIGQCEVEEWKDIAATPLMK